jgi:hypothetical protein
MEKWSRGFVFTALVLVWLFLTSHLWLSGPRDSGFLLFGPHDTLWHLGLISEVAQRKLTPQFPGMNGVPLGNYNYLTDLAGGLLVRASGLSNWQWYCRLGNWLIMAGFILIVYLVAKKISRDWQGGLFSILLTTLGGTAFFIPLINPFAKNWSANSFMLSPIETQTTNLHAIVGYVILVISLHFFYLFFKKGKTKDGFLAGLFLGFLFGIKSLYFLPFFLACGLINLIRLFQKDSRLFFPFTIGLLTFIVLFLYLIRPAGSPAGEFPFQFRPFWLLQKMVEDPNRFYWPDRVLRDQHYRATNNYFRLTISLIQKLFLYLVGNLWLRLIAIFWLIKKIYQRRGVVFYQLVLLTIIFSLFLPLFIAPNPDHYNAVQTGRIGMFLSAFFLGVALKEKPFAFLLVFFLMVPTTFKPQHQAMLVDRQKYEALRFIKEKSQPQAVIMDLVPEDEYYLVIPALAERKTYFSDTKGADLIGIDCQERLNFQRRIANGQLDPQIVRQLLKENQISYLYTPTDLFDQRQAKNYHLETIFTNQTITVFKTVN